MMVTRWREDSGHDGDKVERGQWTSGHDGDEVLS